MGLLEVRVRVRLGNGNGKANDHHFVITKNTVPKTLPIAKTLLKGQPLDNQTLSNVMHSCIAFVCTCTYVYYTYGGVLPPENIGTHIITNSLIRLLVV